MHKMRRDDSFYHEAEEEGEGECDNLRVDLSSPDVFALSRHRMRNPAPHLFHSYIAHDICRQDDIGLGLGRGQDP